MRVLKNILKDTFYVKFLYHKLCYYQDPEHWAIERQGFRQSPLVHPVLQPRMLHSFQAPLFPICQTKLSTTFVAFWALKK